MLSPGIIRQGFFYVLSCNCRQLHLCFMASKNENTPLVRKYPRYGRNIPCPCGSGTKFKNCCGLAYRSNLQTKVINTRFNAMKDAILNYLRSDRRFDPGVKLYRKVGQNKMLLRKLNIQGATQHNLEMLHYQLFKVTGLPDSDFFSIMQRPVLEPSAPRIVMAPSSVDVNGPDQGQSDVGKISVVEATKKKLRDEFPFLSDKSCPDAFKILVADMLTAHENYVRAHNDLFNISDEKQAFEAADRLISNYLDNRAIWDELNHYKNSGQILGAHPYFAGQRRRKELSDMSVPDLINLKDRLEMNIWRNKKKMEDDPKPHLVKDREKRISLYASDLKIVKGLLNIND